MTNTLVPLPCVQDPAYRTLKHVDLDSELELRRQEKHQRSSRRLLKDIEAGKKRQFLLLSEVRMRVIIVLIITTNTETQ